MSSHHFVREGQEPALLITRRVTFESAMDLLEWAPKLIVTSDALESVLSWGVKIDVVVVEWGTDQSVYDLLADSHPVDIISCDQNEPAIARALLLSDSPVNVLTTGAADLLDVIGPFLAARDKPVVLFADHAKWTFHAKNFKKWVPEGAVFYLYRTRDDQVFDTNGTISNGDGYTAIQDGIVHFSSDAPFWVVEQQIF